MEKAKEVVNALSQKGFEFVKEMERGLVELVKKAGGRINTSGDDIHKDTIWGICFDEYEEVYREIRIDEVWVENDTLYYTGTFCDPHSLEEEVDGTNTYSIRDGMTMDLPTLAILCEDLPNFV